MRWPTSTRETTAMVFGLLVGSLLFTGCFGGSEDGEVAIISGQTDGAGDPASGQQSNGDNQSGDSQSGNGQDSGNQDGDGEDGGGGPDEGELLEIVANAEGSGANPDNRTGAPPTIPVLLCQPVDGAISFAELNMSAPQGRIRTALGCIDWADLSYVTIVGPDGEVHDRLWADGLFSMEFSVFDQSGPYQVTAQQRQGQVLTGTFELQPLSSLALSPFRSDGGWKLALAGYGSETSVRVSAYSHAGDGAFVNDLVYFSDLGEIQLDDDGITVVDITTEEDFLCFYVDTADEGRFPNYDPGCFDTRLSIAYQPGDSDLAQSLNVALGDSQLIAIGAVVAPIGEGRSAAIATIINRDSGDPAGAALFEGKANQNPDLGLINPELVDRNADQDFSASFAKMCEAASDRYVVIGNPCLRNIELPPVIVFDYIKPIKVDVLSVIDIVGQAAITDCLPYDPKQLTVSDEGAAGWLLTDGRSPMALLDNKADAATALAVAQYHDQHCFVGRSNKRKDRDAYVADFWLGGKPGGPVLGSEDCLRYRPADLKIVDAGAQGWQLTDGRSSILVLDTEADAQKALNTAAGFTAQCFAGRGNARAERDRYVFQYWK